MSEKDKKQDYKVVLVGDENRYNIKKALNPVQLHREEVYNSNNWVYKIDNQYGLAALVDDSTILNQCIVAYRNNIAGFGISLRYKVDMKEETEEMKAEWSKAEEIINLMSFDIPLKEVFENAIEEREKFGVAYLEVIRNAVGEVVQIENITNTPSITVSIPLEPYVEYKYIYNNKEFSRKKKFKKYRQEINGKTVYFKEFGDMRIMNKDTGTYNENVQEAAQANEILELKIGVMPYGRVRWYGNVLSADGARRAEMLNNNYFRKGRHTPLMIVVRGGSLTDESFDKLKEYMSDIEGEKGQHGFVVLEVENTEVSTALDKKETPEIEIKDLSPILQKDELFQEYLSNSRRKIQSAFLLPDIYTGYTTDFNRATAQTAMEVTEKQVFQPEREALAWIVNNKLLNGYGFKYVEVIFNGPDITNPDDVANLLDIGERAGGMTLNDARELVYQTLGKEAEPYNDNIGNMPLALIKEPETDVGAEITKQIRKAKANNDDDIVPILKEIRKALRRDGSE